MYIAVTENQKHNYLRSNLFLSVSREVEVTDCILIIGNMLRIC